ncbi:hypothetical protein [Candidatus Thiosymbion oneisti]|uniref:hypothetical protein n=1 Tax=Candidatus Thiosymbion oneisti TaxID=589554 RepID=UPI00105D3C99|nr:hypothetical protein [Candidatus Thiosymbion oneisti]
MFFPFSLPFFPFNLHGPSSGDLSLFSPEVHIAGNPKIEKKVVTDVASYGTQLGTLSKVVLALAEGKESEHIDQLDQHIDQLRKRVERIKKIKEDNAVNAEEDIKYRLEELKNNHKEVFERVIKSHHEEIKKAESSNR